MESKESTDNKSVEESRLQRQRNRFEINNTLILAIATLAVTWCSYQSNLWNGVQTFRLADANVLNRLANEKRLEMGQSKDVDVAIIVEFADAVLDSNERKIGYILRGVRPEMKVLLSNWLAKNPEKDPSVAFHPLLMEEYNKLMKGSIRESHELEKKSIELWESADRANTISDNYNLFTVIFSMVMFLGAIGTKITHHRLSFGLILFSGILCMVVLAIVFFTMPLAVRG